MKLKLLKTLLLALPLFISSCGPTGSGAWKYKEGSAKFTYSIGDKQTYEALVEGTQFKYKNENDIVNHIKESLISNGNTTMPDGCIHIDSEHIYEADTVDGRVSLALVNLYQDSSGCTFGKAKDVYHFYGSNYKHLSFGFEIHNDAAFTLDEVKTEINNNVMTISVEGNLQDYSLLKDVVRFVVALDYQKA